MDCPIGMGCRGGIGVLSLELCVLRGIEHAAGSIQNEQIVARNRLLLKTHINARM